MTRAVQILFSFIIGIILDLIFGDPQEAWHPVRVIGALISLLEKQLRRIMGDGRGYELSGGVIMAICVCLSSVLSVSALLFVLYGVNIWAGIAAEGILCYYMFAAKSLKCESMKVYDALCMQTSPDGNTEKNNDTSLDSARKAVSMIVGRDTASLDEGGIIRATVETIAENTSDGVIAPLIFAGLGGAPLLYLYKAVNTMDSMVGYKNDRYMYFGRAAARLDDALNFLPSRISALCMIAAAFLLKGYSGDRAYLVWRRDRLKHQSPNSAQTESAMAGALLVRLAGPACYFGRVVDKPYLGDDLRAIEREDIRRANRLMYMAAGIAAAGLTAGQLLCIYMRGLP